MNDTPLDDSSARATRKLEFARLIAVTAPSTDNYLNQNWWKDLTHETPDDYVLAMDKSTRREKGSFQKGYLSLNVRPGYVIWEAQPLAGDEPQGEFPTMGPFRETLEWFARIMSAWLISCPPIIRLALSAKVLQIAGDVKTAYRVLGEDLPDLKKILNEEPNDFLLQLNKRTISDVVAGLGINRMCTWSKLNAAIAVEPGKPFHWPNRCYSALELDVNTAPEKAEILPGHSVPYLFGELVRLGIEVEERRGDLHGIINHLASGTK